MSERTNIYWAFANERLKMYHRRLKGKAIVTADPILQQYRFTNAYRASDRVSQKLIRIQYNTRSFEDSPAEIFYRTMLFKLFNKLETWQLICEGGYPHSRNIRQLRSLLTDKKGLYSAAYIQASPAGKGVQKAEAHIDLLDELMKAKLWKDIRDAGSLTRVFELLKSVRSFGDFLAFQYTIDLNYSTMIDFDENDFIVPGPGALDGISKIFPGSNNPRSIIRRMTREAPHRMKKDLFGRPLHLIDIQNLFCEISKYTRVSRPDLVGSSGRTTIKQFYKPKPEPLPSPFFPPKWQLKY